MLIAKTSMISGVTRTMDLDVTEEQINAWQNGMLIQRAFPLLSVDEREFLMTGITPDEWDATFAEEE